MQHANYSVLWVHIEYTNWSSLCQQPTASLSTCWTRLPPVYYPSELTLVWIAVLGGTLWALKVLERLMVCLLRPSTLTAVSHGSLLLNDRCACEAPGTQSLVCLNPERNVSPIVHTNPLYPHTVSALLRIGGPKWVNSKSGCGWCSSARYPHT